MRRPRRGTPEARTRPRRSAGVPSEQPELPSAQRPVHSWAQRTEQPPCMQDKQTKGKHVAPCKGKGRLRTQRYRSVHRRTRKVHQRGEKRRKGGGNAQIKTHKWAGVTPTDRNSSPSREPVVNRTYETRREEVEGRRRRRSASEEQLAQGNIFLAARNSTTKGSADLAEGSTKRCQKSAPLPQLNRLEEAPRA